MISKNKARLSKNVKEEETKDDRRPQTQAQKPKPDNEKSQMDGLDNIKPPSISMDENTKSGGFPQEPNKIGF